MNNEVWCAISKKFSKESWFSRGNRHCFFFVAPNMMRQVFDAFGQLFGPLAIIMIIVAALPSKRTKS